MATNTQLDIIAHLLNQEEPQTIRGIAKTLKKSYPLVYNAIQDLAKKKVVFKKKVPPAQAIEINPYSDWTLRLEAEKKRALSFLSVHQGFHVFLEDVLRKATSTYFTLLIFGSYAKGTQTAHSDLDILIIVPIQDNVYPMEKVASEIYSKVKKHFIIVQEKDFIEMISKADQFNVGNEAKKHHILLYGAEQYYELIHRAKQ